MLAGEFLYFVIMIVKPKLCFCRSNLWCYFDASIDPVEPGPAFGFLIPKKYLFSAYSFLLIHLCIFCWCCDCNELSRSTAKRKTSAWWRNRNIVKSDNKTHFIRMELKLKRRHPFYEQFFEEIICKSFNLCFPLLYSNAQAHSGEHWLLC